MRQKVLTIGFTLLLMMSGCREAGLADASFPSSSQDTTVHRIGVSFPMTDLMFRGTMFQMLEETYPDEIMEQTGIQLILCDGENSQRKQNQDLKDLIEEPVDGIILIPYTMEGSLSMLQYANHQNIPVLTLDNRVESTSFARTVGYVGADHNQMGQEAARLLLSALESRFPDEASWNVIYLTGIPNSSGAVDRDIGINQVLSQDSRIHLLGEYNGEFTSVNAKSIMEDCLNVYPTIHGVICQNDFMAEGCYQALDEAGRAGEIAVIGIDGQRSVVEKIAQGKIDGTVIQYPDMVLEAVDWMHAYLDGTAMPYISDHPIAPISQHNAQEYLDAGLPW